ncbi:hypothetical protein LQ772_06705 [Frateuria edaphi]|uniref:hypothetical protein n=1 Tax=Frateuria edaphi TaxID=2898793 RepID=UPI001E492AE5|nr:hypothetical protein [Frateuria edaphi]UGB46975.1 hypothetical protein LQ772_06705 [Frateuria edaphi]
MTCVHFLDLAIAIQNERDVAKRMQLLRALEEPARSPVLAWLWADAKGRDSTLGGEAACPRRPFERKSA